MRGTFDNEIKKALATRGMPSNPKKKFPGKSPAPHNPAIKGADAEDMLDGGLDDNQEDAAGNVIPKKKPSGSFKPNRPSGFKPKA